MRKRTLGLLVAAITLGSTVWLACGGSDGAADLTTPPGNDGGDLPETSSTLDGGGGADGSSTTDAADASDDGSTTAEAGGGEGGINPPDAGPGGTTTTIKCGSTTCAIPAQTCCVDRLGAGMTSYACATVCGGVDAGGDTTALKCSGQANCAAGTVCCVEQVGQNGAASQCQVTCTMNQAQLCDSTATVTGCAVGTMCSNNNIGDWNLPPSYATCGGKGN